MRWRREHAPTQPPWQVLAGVPVRRPRLVVLVRVVLQIAAQRARYRMALEAISTVGGVRDSGGTSIGPRIARIALEGSQDSEVEAFLRRESARLR